MTKDEAIAFAGTKWWETVDNETIVAFQLFEDKLCMPFERFHEAMEKVLDRPVFTHEFAFDSIKQEVLGLRPKATFEDILNLIPEEKRFVVEI